MCFHRIHLVCGKQDKLFKSAIQCGKCMHKRNVATWIYNYTLEPILQNRLCSSFTNKFARIEHNRLQEQSA